jgi:hypothetical protein
MLLFHATDDEQIGDSTTDQQLRSPAQEFKNNTMNDGSRKPEEFPIPNQQKQ